MINNFKSAIESSQKRCELLNVSKDQVYSKKIISDDILQEKFTQKRNLIVTAIPYMEQLIDFVRGNNFFALLTDEEGCILSALGDEKILSEAFELKMVPGAYMDEENIGTNSMAIVIKTKQPVQLSGEDHYIKKYHKWTCSGAPIKDGQGNLIGVLDLTGYMENVHPHTLGMVIAAANAIEEMMQVKELHRIKNTNNKHIKTIFNAMPVAIITSDINGKIKLFNNKAAQLFGYDEGGLRVKSMSEILNGWENTKGLILAGNNVEHEISVTSQSKNINYSITANSIYNPVDDSIDIICVFEKLKQVKQNAYYTFDNIIGRNKDFLETVQYAKRIANSQSSVLIMGESGTGKEVFAQAIHNYSKRVDGPFITVNCGTIPKQLMEVEFFGYGDAGSADEKRKENCGKFELANGGTIYIDEISELPLDIQIKIQKVLQEGTIQRVGSDMDIPVNVRMIAATNKDLKREVELGRFRNDFYYRLNVLSMYLPSLRKRKDDIDLLIRYFMKLVSDKLNRREIDLTEEQLKMMTEYNWPGNIRELENMVELILNTENVPLEYFKQQPVVGEEIRTDGSLNLENVEREHIAKVLNMNSGNISKSAQILGIRRNTLYSKIKKYNIKL